MSRHNRDRRRSPKYAADVVKAGLLGLAAGTVRPGQVSIVEVMHDDHCSLLRGCGPCNCEPTVGQPVPVPDMPG